MRTKSRLAIYSAAALGMIVSASAATITLVNPSFELPGSGKITTGFDSTTQPNVAGWTNNSLSAYTDAGVEGSNGRAGTSGSWSAYVQAAQGGAYQATGYTIATGNQFTLSWAAGPTSSTAVNLPMLVTLFRTTDGGATRTVIATSTSNLGPTNNVFQSYTLNYTAGAADVGSQIGLEFDMSGTSTANYAGFDNFALDVIPEPSVALLSGLGSLALLRRRRA